MCVLMCVNLFFFLSIVTMMFIKMSRHSLCNKETALNIQMSLI